MSGAEVLEVRSLKQRLQKLCGASRFRQRLLHHGLQLEDDAILKPPMDVQLVLLPFVHTQAEDRALLDAARDGDLLMTEEMLRRPVNPSVVIDNIDECHTPLGMACQAGHQEVVGMLLQASADVDGEFGVYGQESTPLGTAIENGALLIAHTLLACGANPGQPHFWLGTGSFEFPLVIAFLYYEEGTPSFAVIVFLLLWLMFFGGVLGCSSSSSSSRSSSSMAAAGVVVVIAVVVAAAAVLVVVVVVLVVAVVLVN